MEKLSRVEKYKELRESMDAVQERSSGGKPTIESVELRRQLQQIDQPQQGETQSRHSHTPPRFSKEIDVEQTYDTGKETFHNEYLDDFLNEVKEYNIEKGNRLSDNTQIDILLQLNPENRRRRTQHYDPIREEAFTPKEREEDADVSYTQSLSKEELQAEVDKLFAEDAAVKEEPAAVEEAPVANEEPPLTRINPVIPPQAKERQPEEAPEEEAEPTKAIEVEQPQAPAEETAYVNEERLMEETAQIRMQMDDYEGELNDLHDKVSKSNRILNVILLVLIIALIAVIAVTIYWLQQAGGLF